MSDNSQKRPGYRVTAELTSALRRHEEIDLMHAKELMRHIEGAGCWTTPLLVEKRSLVILDGHHRYWVACTLGLHVVPIVALAYDDPSLSLSSWRPDFDVTRSIVLRAAATGRLLPKKTSRHVFEGNIDLCAIPLAILWTRRAA